MSCPTKNLCWNVWWFDSNARKITTRNVFQLSVKFSKGVESIWEKSFDSFSDFSEALRSAAMYAFWGKYEHEVIVAPFAAQGEDKKVDVFAQLDLNWTRFAIYVFSVYCPEHRIDPKTLEKFYQ